MLKMQIINGVLNDGETHLIRERKLIQHLENEVEDAKQLYADNYYSSK